MGLPHGVGERRLKVGHCRSIIAGEESRRRPAK
jgi:hypothetical protein